MLAFPVPNTPDDPIRGFSITKSNEHQRRSKLASSNSSKVLTLERLPFKELSSSMILEFKTNKQFGIAREFSQDEKENCEPSVSAKSN